MRSVSLLVLLFVGASIAAITLDVGYIRDTSSSYGSAQRSLFGVAVSNTGGNVPITDVQYFVVPLNFFGIWSASGNSYFFPGSLHTINANATGSEAFTILTSQLSSAPVILVTAFYWRNGVLSSICGTYYLTKSDTFLSRMIESSDEVANVARDESVNLSSRDTVYYLIDPLKFTAVVGVQTWNSLNFKSSYGNLNKFSYTAVCNDPANTVDIAYQAAGTSIGTVNALSYKQGSISLMGGYPPNGGGDYWNITITATFQVGTNTSYTNQSLVRHFVIYDSSKRTADKDASFTAVTATLSSHSASYTVRAEYSIAFAVAGVVVAAVAIIAAVVIIRRRPQTVPTL